MKKPILFMLFTMFALFFSGKPPLEHECGPIFTIYNSSGLVGMGPYIPVTKLEVQNLTSGITTTYNNPTFPITHSDQGGSFVFTFYFSGSYHGGILYGEPCGVANFHNVTQGVLYANAYCNSYFVDLVDSCPGCSHGCGE